MTKQGLLRKQRTAGAGGPQKVLQNTISDANYYSSNEKACEKTKLNTFKFQNIPQ